MSRSKTILGLLAASTFVIAMPVGCGSDDGESKKQTAPLTPAERLCKTVDDAISSCGSATPCDQALVADCADVVGLLSDSYLESAADCIEAGGVPQTCMAEALGALQSTEAHAAFGTTFCGTCAFGIPGCEETLFSGEGEFAVVGKLLLPFSDSLVGELAETCASSALDCATMPSCFQKVIAGHALPENTIQCFMDNLTGEAPPEEASTCSSNTGTETGTGTATGTETGTSTETGTGTGTGMGIGGGDFATVVIDGMTMNVTGFELWDASVNGTVSVFIDIEGPGLPAGSDVVVDLVSVGTDCTANFLALRPDLSSSTYTDQYFADSSSGCGLQIGSIPSVAGDIGAGTFNGTLYEINGGSGPDTVSADIAFQVTQ